MPDQVIQASKKQNYDFIDHIRAIAMIAIVAEHSLGTNPVIGSDNYWVNIGMAQLTKFGTIAFFLLAGFLIGDKFTDYTPGQYLKRRFSNTFGPWLFWSGMFIVCYMVNLQVKANMYHDDRFNWENIWNEIQMVYLYSNYWFIINFMVSITLLLIFKKYLYSLKLGLMFFAFTLFYSVNVYFNWVNPAHTTAILGFVFFLWLGAQLRKNWLMVEQYIKKVPYWLIIVLFAISYTMAYQEILLIMARKSIHGFNTLRFSNILYSLSVFALLLKIRTFKALDALQPRQTTFGIYLIHAIILVFATPEILRPLHIEGGTLSLVPFILYNLMLVVLNYSITWMLVKLINYTKAKRLVGN
jgi:hypothetical protein